MMSDNRVCCGAIEKLAGKFDWPLYRPLILDKETKDLKPGDWSIKLINLTSSGKISKDSATAIINYCPFCGARLVEKAENGG